MTAAEFKESVGGVNALLMECTHATEMDGRAYKAGDPLQVTTAKAYAMHRTECWKPLKGVKIATIEAAALNSHFEKEHAQEMGDKPKKVQTKSKK